MERKAMIDMQTLCHEDVTEDIHSLQLYYEERPSSHSPGRVTDITREIPKIKSKHVQIWRNKLIILPLLDASEFG